MSKAPSTSSEPPVPSLMSLRKKTRKSYSFQEKAAMINALETKPLTTVARKNDINEKLLYKWKRNHDLILEAAESELLAGKKKNKPINEELEDHLYNWFVKARSAGIAVSGPIVRAVALDLNKQLGGKETFKASHGWLDRWKKHKNIRFPRERSSPRDSAESFDHEAPDATEEQNFIKTEEISPPGSPDLDADDHKDFVVEWLPIPPASAPLVDNFETEIRVKEEPASSFDESFVKIERVSPSGSPRSEEADDRAWTTASPSTHGETSPPRTISPVFEDDGEFSRKSRRSYSFQEKADIVTLLKTRSASDVALETGIHYRLLYKWMKNEALIVEASKREDLSGRKQKVHRNEELADHVYNWYQAAQSAGIHVTGPIIKAVALDLNRQLGGKETFKASCGWLGQWKRFKNVVLPKPSVKPFSYATARSRENPSREVIATENFIKPEPTVEDGSLPGSSTGGGEEHTGFITEWLPMSEEVSPPSSPDFQETYETVGPTRRSYSFAVKAKVLKALETESHKVVARKFGINAKTMYRWKRDRLKILEAAKRDSRMRKSRNRLGKFQNCATSSADSTDSDSELEDDSCETSDSATLLVHPFVAHLSNPQFIIDNR
ncbi:uncharacterized protein LOC135162091 isoform X1 [Diachasmimorpha longicaudata]|uniref:uncharacterized protein LOC135162091 isoform X1 n=1 Tax=Diachasmimorpha longicaudata TaxID=58733 RepID=UPI0030B8B701